MKDKRREILLGYLLEALEPHESAKVDAELETNEQLQQDLAEIYREISPINEIVDYHEPPADLAGRTCRNLWEKIDSSNAEKSTKNNPIPLTPHSSPKKLRATIVFTQPQPEPPKNDAIISVNIDPQSSPEELRLDVPIPLSQAVRMAGDKPHSVSKLIRRLDTAEQTPAAPSKLHQFFAEDAKPTKGQLPKYYGRKAKAEIKAKRPWMVRDVFASLLVGLTAAVLIFPIIQMGIGNFREMIVQKKLQSVAQNMSPNTSQFSPYGLSQGDLRAFVSMNIDPHSASQLQAQRANAKTFSFSSSPKTTAQSPVQPLTQTPLQMPLIVPASLSFPVSDKSFRTISPDPLRIVPDFLTVIDNSVAVSPHTVDRNTTLLRSDNKANPLTGELPKQDVVDILLIRELANRSNLSRPKIGNTMWQSPGCNFIGQTP